MSTDNSTPDPRVTRDAGTPVHDASSPSAAVPADDARTRPNEQHDVPPRNLGDPQDVRDQRGANESADVRAPQDSRDHQEPRVVHDDRHDSRDHQEPRVVHDDRHDSRDRQEPRVVHDDRDMHHVGGGTAVPVEDAKAIQHDVHEREKAEFGGFKFGSAFFGWLTAMGTTVLLTALVTAIGAAIGIGNDVSPEEAAESAFGTGGIVAAIVIGLVLLISYYAGGYVAGRMARFSGAKQGIAVWLWAIIVAIVVAIITAIAGAQWDILGNLQGFPRIPVTPETATLTGILTALGAAIVTLVGAILGGLAGMRFHRKVDRVGLGH